MTDMTFEDFMRLHDAMRLKNRLNRAVRSGIDTDDTQVEGYMMEDERCDSESIEGYMMKTVSDEERQKVDAHLEKCDSCSKTLDGLRELRDVLENSLIQFAPRGEREEPREKGGE